jgi:hypothetical protein
MKISKQTSQELMELQEDVASQFCTDHFPISGEAYWTMVESLASAKLAQIKGWTT